MIKALLIIALIGSASAATAGNCGSLP